MGFFGGASSSEKRAQERATRTAEDRYGSLYDRASTGADRWGTRSWDQITGVDNQRNFMWDQLWGEGGAFNPAAGGGGGGGGGGGPRFDNTLWKQLRDTGDLTPGDWGKARETYDMFRTTGGFTDDDLTNLRQRALSGTEIYDPSADVRSRVQGGWGAGDQAGNLARLKAIADLRNKAAWGAEGYISDKTREGKQWGATSLEGLGSKVQAGRIQGQTHLDQQAREAAAARRAAAARAAASRDAQWSRSMQLMGMGYGNVGQTGADLPYLQTAGQMAGGAVGARQTAFGQQQQNQGWGQQLMNMANTGAQAYSSAFRPPGT